jgi:hypothetical protein
MNNSIVEKPKIYIGTYKVVKYFKSGRKQVLHRGLTKDEAISKVNSYPDRNHSLVGFTKQFYADKYFVTDRS